MNGGTGQTDRPMDRWPVNQSTGDTGVPVHAGDGESVTVTPVDHRHCCMPTYHFLSFGWFLLLPFKYRSNFHHLSFIMVTEHICKMQSMVADIFCLARIYVSILMLQFYLYGLLYYTY